MTTKLTFSLSSLLLLLIITLNLLCMLAVSSYVLYEVNQAAIQNIQRQTDIASKTIEFQALRLTIGFENIKRFPDLAILDQADNNQGSCVSFVSEQQRKSTCVASGVTQVWPDWFETVYLNVFHSADTITKRIDYKGKHYGILTVSQDVEVPLNQAWQKFSYIMQLSLALLLSLSALLILSMKLVLKPVDSILAALKSISKNQLDVTLKPVQIKEWNTISNAITDMANNLTKSEQHNNQLTKKLVMIQEQERQHIAQELHDELAQSLAGLSATQSTLLRLAQLQAPDLVPHIQRASQISETMRQQCRQILAEIKPMDLDASHFQSNLQQLISLWNVQSDTTQFKLQVESDLTVIPNDMLIHLYRIIQEGLTNIAKHAYANHAQVTLVINAQHILNLSIEDDGALRELPKQQNGFGLIGIKERVKALDGLYQISINKPHGLLISITIPLPRLNHELS